MLHLTYDPVYLTYRLPDPSLQRNLHNYLRVKDPEYDPSNPESYEYIEFFEPENKRILTGLLSNVQEWARINKVELVLKGWPENDEEIEVRSDLIPGVNLEEYQIESIRTCISRQRGVLEIATGGGKTEIAIGLTLALGKPKTLYVVPDVSAMHEIYERYCRRGFSKKVVGRVGEGYDEYDRRIIVACIASLYSGIKRNYPETAKLLNTAGLLFLDEVHHQATAFSWQAVASCCKAQRRIGMSGTPYKDSRSRIDPSFVHPYDTWLKGYTGDTLVYIPPGVLQEMGKLTCCKMVVFPAGGKKIWGSDWHKVYDKAITNNFERNIRIATLAANLCDAGRKPLISVEKLAHGRIIQRLLLKMGIVGACSYGAGVLIVPKCVISKLPSGTETTPVPLKLDDEPHPNRKIKEEEFEDDYVHIPTNTNVKTMLFHGDIDLIIGSKIYDESLDFPFLTDLINGAGGKASQRFRQKVGRILRLFKGKSIATVWDPWDDCHEYVRKHSKLRIEIIKEEGYKVEFRPVPECLYRFRVFLEREVTMKMKSISVGASITIPCGSYNSIKPSVTLTAELEDGEDMNTAYEELSKRTMTLFMREASNLAYWDGTIMQKGVPAAASEFLSLMVPPDSK